MWVVMLKKERLEMCAENEYKAIFSLFLFHWKIVPSNEYEASFFTCPQEI